MGIGKIAHLSSFYNKYRKLNIHPNHLLSLQNHYIIPATRVSAYQTITHQKV